MKLFAVTGEKCSGKHTCIEYLNAQYNIPLSSIRSIAGVVINHMTSLGWDPKKQDCYGITDFARIQRLVSNYEECNPDLYSKSVLESLAQGLSPGIVHDIMTMRELMYFQKHTDLHIIHITAPISIRFERWLTQATNYALETEIPDKTNETIQSFEALEADEQFDQGDDKIQLGKIMEYARAHGTVIVNQGSKQDLNRKLDEIMASHKIKKPKKNGNHSPR